MALRRLGIWVAVILLVLFAVNVVVSTLFTALSALLSIVYTALVVAVLGGLLYGIVRMAGITIGDDQQVTDRGDARGFDGDREQTSLSSAHDSEDRIDTLRDLYASGDISEAELERELDRELGTDNLGRQRERERR